MHHVYRELAHVNEKKRNGNYALNYVINYYKLGVIIYYNLELLFYNKLGQQCISN